MTTQHHPTMKYPRLNMLLGAAGMYIVLSMNGKLTPEQLASFDAAEARLDEMEKKIEQDKAWNQAASNSISRLEQKVKELQVPVQGRAEISGSTDSPTSQGPRTMSDMQQSGMQQSVEDELAALRAIRVIK